MNRNLLLLVALIGCGDKEPPTQDSSPVDADGDGFLSDVDCDDERANVNPDAEEICDEVDQDCDELVDEGVADVWYRDADADGFGDPNDAVEACSVPPDGYVSTSDDCDDTSADARPGGEETCDTLDNDCDALVDEGVTDAGFLDADGDGYGDDNQPTESCGYPQGVAEQGGDCDDTTESIRPGAPEECNDLDDDCDAAVDEGRADYYPDDDGDGFGRSDGAIEACSRPQGHVLDDTDCDDTSSTVYPGANTREVPFDGVDADCDGNDFCDDLNCDARPDLVFQSYVGNSGDRTPDSLVYLNGASGFGSALSLPTHGVLRSVSSDLNQDGYPDLVFPGYYDGDYYTTLSIYWGSANGPDSSDVTELPCVGARDARVEDFDQDGWPDIVVAQYYNGGSYDINSYVYWGSANGYSEADRTDLPTKGALALDVGDLNQDGYPDVVFAGYRSQSSDRTSESYVYWGSASGLSSGDRTGLAHPRRMTNVLIEDMDGDGWQDLVLVAEYDGRYTTNSMIVWGSSRGYAVSRVQTVQSVGGWDAAAADLNADGVMDLAFASYRNDAGYTGAYNYVYDGPSYGSSARTPLDTAAAREVTAADMNNDGWLDLVYSSYYNGSTYGVDSFVYWGSSAGFTNTDRTDLPTVGALGHRVGDVNSDGWLDIVFNSYRGASSSANYSQNSLVYWGGSSGFQTSNVTELPTTGPWGSPLIVGAD